MFSLKAVVAIGVGRWNILSRLYYSLEGTYSARERVLRVIEAVKLISVRVH